MSSKSLPIHSLEQMRLSAKAGHTSLGRDAPDRAKVIEVSSWTMVRGSYSTSDEFEALGIHPTKGPVTLKVIDKKRDKKQIAKILVAETLAIAPVWGGLSLSALGLSKLLKFKAPDEDGKIYKNTDKKNAIRLIFRGALNAFTDNIGLRFWRYPFSAVRIIKKGIDLIRPKRTVKKEMRSLIPASGQMNRIREALIKKGFGENFKIKELTHEEGKTFLLINATKTILESSNNSSGELEAFVLKEEHDFRCELKDMTQEHKNARKLSLLPALAGIPIVGPLLSLAHIPLYPILSKVGRVPKRPIPIRIVQGLISAAPLLLSLSGAPPLAMIFIGISFSGINLYTAVEEEKSKAGYRPIDLIPVENQES